VHTEHPQGVNHLRFDVIGHHKHALAETVATRLTENVECVSIEKPNRSNEQISLPAAQAPKQAAAGTFLPYRGMRRAAQQRTLHGIGHELVTHGHPDRVQVTQGRRITRTRF
jgi:hypothetical protein